MQHAWAKALPLLFDCGEGAWWHFAVGGAGQKTALSKAPSSLPRADLGVGLDGSVQPALHTKPCGAVALTHCLSTS